MRPRCRSLVSRRNRCAMLCAKHLFVAATALPEPKRPEPYGQSARRMREIANSEIEADEHHERDKPLIALGGTVRDDKHAAVVDGRRASPQEGAKN